MPVKQMKQFPGMAPPPVRTPRCNANVNDSSTHEERWRTERYGKSDRPFQCSRPSVVEINGKPYCRLHGAHIVLDMYIKGELVDRPPPTGKAGTENPVRRTARKI